MDLLFCAKYPFTREAKKFLENAKVALSPRIISLAEDRILKILNGEKLLSIGEGGENYLLDIIASHAASRAIISCLGNRYLANRYAIAIAKKSSEYLRKEEKEIESIAKEFGLVFRKKKNGFAIRFSQYLLYSPKSINYKLVNRGVSNGFVFITQHERIRILEEAIKTREEHLPKQKDFPKEIKEACERIRKKLPQGELSGAKIESRNFPPCIKKIIEDFYMNKNVPHTARWYLGVYLINAKMPLEKIIEIYSYAPDFNRKTTEYQLSHIKNKGYKVPNCDMVDTYGLCIATCGCFNPIKFREKIHGRNVNE